MVTIKVNKGDLKNNVVNVDDLTYQQGDKAGKMVEQLFRNCLKDNGDYEVAIKRKTPRKTKAYRSYIKRYYNIEFGSEYAVHHIDFNHDNNDIQNLMVMPKSLHNKYHMIVNQCGGINVNGVNSIMLNAEFGEHTTHTIQVLTTLIETLKECEKWYNYKLYLDGLASNLYGIDLSKKENENVK